MNQKTQVVKAGRTKIQEEEKAGLGKRQRRERREPGRNWEGAECQIKLDLTSMETPLILQRHKDKSRLMEV